MKTTKEDRSDWRKQCFEHGVSYCVDETEFVDLIDDADRCAELERLYSARCREIIALQGQIDRLRAGLEKVRGLEASLRKRPDVAAPWVSLDLAAALDLAGVEKETR